MDLMKAIYAKALEKHSQDEIKTAEEWIRTQFSRFVCDEHERPPSSDLSRPPAKKRHCVVLARYRFSRLDCFLERCEEREIGNPGADIRVEIKKLALMFIDIILDESIPTGKLEAMIEYDRSAGFGYARYFETFPDWRVEPL